MPVNLATLLQKGHYPNVDRVCKAQALLKVGNNLNEWRTAAYAFFSPVRRATVIVGDLKRTDFDEEGKRQQMLQKWAEENGTEATYRELATILLKIGQRSLAEELLQWSNEFEGEQKLM